MTQEVTTKATFPSVDWFNAVKEIVNDDPGYKHIGTCDTVIGLKVPDIEKNYRITFEAFEVTDVSEVPTTARPRTRTSGWRCRTRAGKR